MQNEQKKCSIYIALSLVFAMVCSCSKPVKESVDPPSENIPGLQVDPDKVVLVNSGVIEGPMYNFWSTRPMINQTRFNSASYRASLEDIKPYVKSFNLVRMLGGRTDNLNEFYKGVDASGNVITDFSGLITSMRNFMLTGFKPRIVLDNVPWEMSAKKEMNTYGNSNPPADYGLWRKYIRAFLQALITEFGYNEVKTWRFRVATEPNYAPDHWNGTKEEFFKHYDITVDEVTKLIPDAIIGPGNLLTENSAKWDLELIEHCANGTNYATGGKGTKMDFFCLSYYEKIDQNTVRFRDVIEPFRAKLNSYPQFRNIPFDIQEFGMLRDENANRGQSLNDATEMGASWYAAIADMVYQYKIAEVYDWGQESEGLPTGRRHVTDMFEMMKEGSRLQTVKKAQGIIGVIPVSKGNKIYLLVYNHNTTRNSTAANTLFPKIEGDKISGATKWKMNEWTVDKSHGIFMHELYKDCNAAGVAKKSRGRIYGNQVSDYFEDAWSNEFTANKNKYEQMARLQQTIKDSVVTKSNGNITLKVDLAPHSVKLIELIPQ